MSNTPNDDILFELIKEHFDLDKRRFDTVIDRKTGRFHDAARYRDFASAVLARWGSPQPVVREPQWINPNDKTQQQYLPHIGEPVLFCHKGTTYYGKHTGGIFVSGVGFAQKHFNTWHCHWMYPPAAHGITQKGGD